MHYYDVHTLAPIRYVPLETLVSLKFRLFVTGVRQFFADGLPEVFVHDNNPPVTRSQSLFRMMGSEEINTVIGGKFLSEWRLVYECNCDRPGSVRCLELAKELFEKWASLLKDSIRPGPYEVDLELMAEKRIRHCRECVKDSPLTLLYRGIGLNRPSPFIISEDGIQLRIPKSSKHTPPFPCFIDFIQQYVPQCKITYY